MATTYEDVLNLFRETVVGRTPLEFREMKYFQELVSARANEIIQKWIDFFILHKSVKPERITRRLP